MKNSLYCLYLKRALDFCASLIGLVILSPLLLMVMLSVWAEDGRSPFYIAPRVGKNGRIFKMLKLRSMRVDADKAGVSSTKSDDDRITRTGRVIRKFKLDEFMQLYNVLKGDMSLVGPRPQVEWAVKLYTNDEKKMLTVRPGITDLASIVFADEGEILNGSKDPDADYDRLIRPWKSKLALLSIENQSFSLDLKITLLTVAAISSRTKTLRSVSSQVAELTSEKAVIQVASREGDLRLAFASLGNQKCIRNTLHP